MRLRRVATVATMLTVIAGGISGATASADDPETYEIVTHEEITEPSTPASDAPRAHLAPGASPAERRADQAPKETPEEMLERAKAAKKLRSTAAPEGPQQPAARAYPPVSATECKTMDSADRPEGWVLDHNFWCKTGIYKLGVTVCTGVRCQEKEYFQYRLNTLGTVKPGTRSVQFVSNIEAMAIKGTPAFRKRVVTLDMKCTKSTGSKCKGDPQNKQSQSIEKWLSQRTAFFTLSSPETGAVNQDKVSWHDFKATSTLDGGETKPVTTGKNGFRCDSATHAGSHKGCVYDKTTELFYDMVRTDPEVNQTAAHIYDAQSAPYLTFPKKDDKAVPGSPTSGRPLTRVFHNKSLRRANHRKAVETCKENFGADYAQHGLECDEYPFQSTAQGAATGDDNYSARALDAEDNGRGGTRLGQFYDRQRVIDGDPFYVLVVD